MNADWRDTCPSNKDKVIYMYKNNLRTDCSFVVGEGEEKKVFRAHKFVLTFISAVFEAMMYSDVGQDMDNICIPDVDPDVFQTFLNGIYLEEVAPRSFIEACNLLDLASKYMIKWMTDQCLSYIAANITPSNAAVGFQVLSLYGHTDLASSCWKVIQEETSQVLNSEDFTDLGKETLVRILEEDRLAVESESELASAVQRWVEADLQWQGLTEDADRLALLSEFLPYIRFISMSVEEFINFPALFSYHDFESIVNKILDPESPASLPPNVCSKKRVFLPKKVPLPGDWEVQLHRAAVDGDVGELRRLQAAGADLLVRDDGGRPLVHWAARYGHAECVQWLLEQGLSPHSTDGVGWTPLHEAAYRGRLETVRLLLDSGADPAARTRDGRTPLHWAALWGRLETVRLLLDIGADPAARDSAGRTALDYAISLGHSAVAALLRRRDRFSR